MFILAVVSLLATTTNAQWIVTPSTPVSGFMQPHWKVDADLNDDYMVITYGNQNPSTAPGGTGTFMKVFTGINTPVTGDIPVFNMGFHLSRVKISDANNIYVLGTADYGAVTKLTLKKYSVAGIASGSIIINISTAAEMYDLAVTANNDVLVSLFDGNDVKILCYDSNLAYKGAIVAATAITHFNVGTGNLRAQFIDFNSGHILIGYSRGVDASLTSFIKKYQYNSSTPASSPLVATYTFTGGFKSRHLEGLNSHQVALRANGDVFYVNGLSGVRRISGATTTTVYSNATSKVNVDASDNVLITWTDNSMARARLYNASNAFVHQYSEGGNINGSWAAAIHNCKFVIAGDKNYQGTDYHTNRKPHYQVFNCSNCVVGAPATASAEFRFPNQVIAMNSLYGPQDVAELCLVDELLVNGSASCNETGYFVEIAEFNLMTWTNINVLYSNWVCTGCQAPNNIDITSFLPQGYQLRPGKVYRFRLAVGSPWHSVDIFFTIACCRRSIDHEEEFPDELTPELREDTIREIAPEESEANSAVKVFPNPADDEVTLQFVAKENAAEVMVSVTDFTGTEVYTSKTTEETMTLNIASWEAGIYIVTISINGKSYTQRILKQ